MKEFFNILISNRWGIAAIILFCLFFLLILSIILYKRFFKRFYDILLSGIALILLSPVFLIISILIRIKLGAPVIFTQMRPGKNGKIFKLHKFRSMTDERDERGELIADELRLTKFGNKLRKTSLDELPEIWDIFIGKMSIIGPRPQLVRDLVFMSDEVKKRHSIRPGLTGLAQVSGRNNIEWDERFRYDLKYAEKISFWIDVKIFFRTIFKVFKKSDVSTDGMATSEDYGDWLLRKGEITQDEYDIGQNIARNELSKKK